MKKNSNCDIDQRLDVFLEEGMGEIFEAASEDGLDLRSFTDAFLRSKAFEEYFTDATIFSQAPRYVLELFDEEGHAGIGDAEYDEVDIAFWFGYLFATWHIEEGTGGTEIADNYNIGDIWHAFDTLHTQSIEYAIDFIKSEYGAIEHNEECCL